jgi:hypothetical protein
MPHGTLQLPGRILDRRVTSNPNNVIEARIPIVKLKAFQYLSLHGPVSAIEYDRSSKA